MKKFTLLTLLAALISASAVAASAPRRAANELVTSPEGLVTEEWAISAVNNYGSPVSGYLYIGFLGNEVYLQGLCTYLPEAWIKGTLHGTTITFEGNQYFGPYDGGMFAYYEFLLCEEGIALTYDAEAGKMTAEGEIYVYTKGSNLKGDVYNNLVVTKMIEKAAKPATPVISEIYDTTGSHIFTFTVPTTDVNGNAMASSKLSFQFLKEVEQEISPVTFAPADYPALTQPTSVFPYGFADSHDFYPTTIIFRQADYDTWSKIGLQAIYTGGGEENKSEIFWIKNPTNISGISPVQGEKLRVGAGNLQSPFLYNLSGQRLSAPRKGLNIINGKKTIMK